MAEESTKKKRRREENIEIIIKNDFLSRVEPGYYCRELAESHSLSVFIDVF